MLAVVYKHTHKHTHVITGSPTLLLWHVLAAVVKFSCDPLKLQTDPPRPPPKKKEEWKVDNDTLNYRSILNRGGGGGGRRGGGFHKILSICCCMACGCGRCLRRPLGSVVKDWNCSCFSVLMSVALGRSLRMLNIQCLPFVRRRFNDHGWHGKHR